MNPAHHILRTLAKHLEGPASVRLMGGAALIVGYGSNRATEDADLLMTDAELFAFMDSAELGAAIQSTNEELESVGLYLTHIWGPEQQILTPEWQPNCRRVDADWGSPHLTVEVLGPLDLILSKLCRADAQDLADIEHVMRVESLDRRRIEDALATALVPDCFQDVFVENTERLFSFLDQLG